MCASQQQHFSFSFPPLCVVITFADASLLLDSSDTNIIPPFSPPTHTAFAAHARLLSWFVDAPAVPFGGPWRGRWRGKDVGM
ncbi:hypothetical protein B0H10DRAFT_2013801 [Mycena sp. CBHHK59/15]|nr:hypothetical protein B0H10DRAFT_2013801 [Mycena sp. CBHHK59/15]